MNTTGIKPNQVDLLRDCKNNSQGTVHMDRDESCQENFFLTIKYILKELYTVIGILLLELHIKIDVQLY